MLQNFPFLCEVFTLDRPPPSSRLKFQKYSKTIWQRNIQNTKFFFCLFCFVRFSHNTHNLQWFGCFTGGGVSCTHHCHAFLILHSVTYTYINVFIPCFSNLLFCLSERQRHDWCFDCQKCHAIGPFCDSLHCGRVY